MLSWIIFLNFVITACIQNIFFMTMSRTVNKLNFSKLNRVILSYKCLKNQLYQKQTGQNFNMTGCNMRKTKRVSWNWNYINFYVCDQYKTFYLLIWLENALDWNTTYIVSKNSMVWWYAILENKWFTKYCFKNILSMLVIE